MARGLVIPHGHIAGSPVPAHGSLGKDRVRVEQVEDSAGLLGAELLDIIGESWVDKEGLLVGLWVHSDHRVADRCDI